MQSKKTTLYILTLIEKNYYVLISVVISNNLLNKYQNGSRFLVFSAIFTSRNFISILFFQDMNNFLEIQLSEIIHAVFQVVPIN